MGKLDLMRTSDETLRALEALTYTDLLVSDDPSYYDAENHIEVKRELYRRGMEPRIKASFDKKEF